MVLEFVYESRTESIRSEPIPQLIFGLIYLLVLTRFVWPLQLPLSIKIVVAVLALVALQFTAGASSRRVRYSLRSFHVRWSPSSTGRSARLFCWRCCN